VSLLNLPFYVSSRACSFYATTSLSPSTSFFFSLSPDCPLSFLSCPSLLLFPACFSLSCFLFYTPSSVRALTRAPAKNVSATRASGVAIREGSAPRYLVGDEKERVVGLTGTCRGGGIFDYTSEPHVGCHLVLG